MRARMLYRILLAILIATPATVLADLPSTVYVYDMSNSSASQRELMASLAGIVNRTTPELLLSYPGDNLPNPNFWLRQLQAEHPEIQSQSFSNPLVFLTRYRDRLSGYILYDKQSNAESINVATSLAGVHDAIMVDNSTLAYALAAGLTQVADARTMTAADVYAQHASQLSKQFIVTQDTWFDQQLRDLAVAKRAFTFWQPPAMNTYLAGQDHNSRLLGWGPDEQALFSQSSQNNLRMVASNHLQSGSTTSGWTVPLRKQKTHVSTATPTLPGKHYVAFVMSDGDNVQWITNGFPTDPKWFGSPKRGNFTMNWDLSGSLKDINPVALNYLYDHASGGAGAHKDFFVNAGGIVFPSQYPDTAGLVATMHQELLDSDHDIISVIDPLFSASKLDPLLDDPAVMGIMFKTYSDAYKGRNGAIYWHNGKPVASVKYSLWDGFDTPDGLVAALNAAPRNPLSDVRSYSIVNVHPWSTGFLGDPMSNLDYIAARLDPNVVPVTLEELFIHLRSNFGTAVPEPQMVIPMALFAMLRRRRPRCDRGNHH
jgi:hypothetical protein